MNGTTFHSRQSFLGPDFGRIVREARVAVVGVSGGGSHITQQSAHVGFRNVMLFDPQRIGLENMHRHVGATRRDVEEEVPKVEIGKRVIHDLWPDANVLAIQGEWQDHAEHLRTADLIFGCLDGIQARLDLETTARRYRIPLIDIGLGMSGDMRKFMFGQVALSMPGGPCLRCLGLLSEGELADEAAHSGAYAGFGPAPQVVWANGVLASAAVGIAADLFTGWNAIEKPHPRLQFYGNACTLMPYEPETGIPERCEHFSEGELGDP